MLKGKSQIKVFAKRSRTNLRPIGRVAVGKTAGGGPEPGGGALESG